EASCQKGCHGAREGLYPMGTLLTAHKGGRMPTHPPDAMRIHIDKIGRDGFDLDAPVPATWLNDALGDNSPYSCGSDGHLIVHLERVENVVHVQGRARLRLGAACSRCLSPVELGLDT